MGLKLKFKRNVRETLGLLESSRTLLSFSLESSGQKEVVMSCSIQVSGWGGGTRRALQVDGCSPRTVGRGTEVGTRWV